MRLFTTSNWKQLTWQSIWVVWRRFRNRKKKLFFVHFYKLYWTAAFLHARQRTTTPENWNITQKNLYNIEINSFVLQKYFFLVLYVYEQERMHIEHERENLRLWIRNVDKRRQLNDYILFFYTHIAQRTTICRCSERIEPREWLHTHNLLCVILSIIFQSFLELDFAEWTNERLLPIN